MSSPCWRRRGRATASGSDASRPTAWVHTAIRISRTILRWTRCTEFSRLALKFLLFLGQKGIARQTTSKVPRCCPWTVRAENCSSWRSGTPRGEDRTALRVIVACWRHSLLSVQADSGSLTVAGQDRYRPASTRKTHASNLRQFLPNTEFNRANSSERRRIVTLGHLIAGRKVIRSISNGWGINNGRAMFSVRCSSDSQQL